MAGAIGGMFARVGSTLIRPALSSVARGAAETAGQRAASVVGQSAVDQLSTLGSSPAGQIASTFGSMAVQNHLNIVTGGGPLGALMNLPGQISQVTHLAQNLTGGLVRPGGTGGQVLPDPGGAPGSVGTYDESSGPVAAAARPGSVVGRSYAYATGDQTEFIAAQDPQPGTGTNPPYTNPNQSIQSVTYPAGPGENVGGGQTGLAFTTNTNPDGTVSSIQSLPFNVAPGTVRNPADRAMPHADVIADHI